MKSIAIALGLVASGLAQSENWPTLNYRVDPDWPQLPSGWTFEESPGVAVGAGERVFVFHRGPHPLMVFESSGAFIRSWGDGLFGRPHAVKFDREGNLWVVDDGAHFVAKTDAGGRVRLVLGRKGTAGASNELFNRPTDVAFGLSGDIYVTDGYGNSRVVQFTRNGEFVRAWGKKGTGPGEFNLPHAIAVDQHGRVFVGDRDNFRMQVFSGEGKFLEEWTHVGSPWGLVLTPSDELFMCDGYANRILKLDLEGKVSGVLSGPGKLPGRLDFAHHLAVAPSGALYVAEIKNWRVQKFIPEPPGKSRNE